MGEDVPGDCTHSGRPNESRPAAGWKPGATDARHRHSLTLDLLEHTEDMAALDTISSALPYRGSPSGRRGFGRRYACLVSAFVHAGVAVVVVAIARGK